MLSFRGWWEYYFLRYCVGTVVGATVVFLIPDSRAALEYLIPSGMEWKQLATLTALARIIREVITNDNRVVRSR
jgi:hypothetical protein